jgi:hypothetical protein
MLNESSDNNDKRRSNLWRRLADEVLYEIRPLAIATISLIASSSCNHGTFDSRLFDYYSEEDS